MSRLSLNGIFGVGFGVLLAIFAIIGYVSYSSIDDRARSLALILSLVGLVLGVIVAFFIARMVTSAIVGMRGLMNEIAANNLAVPDLRVKSWNEIGQAIDALNRLKNNLASAMRSIAVSTERLASASEEISASATQQSSGAEAQRDQTHQVATAMQEMAATIVQISESSMKAAEVARKASTTAHDGGKIVEETVAKMRGIAASAGETARKVEALGKSSNQIGQIIGVIDDIADQTNLLALNAAIEAARAGEQGRGFAVVADEVRKLAERTSKATKEIAAMIQNIQGETKSAVEAMEAGTKQVEAGVETTTQAGASLRQIIHSAEQVGEMVTHIATAATQQSSATEDVNASVDQIARITSESAEGAQQSAKACHDLSSLALDLQNIVSQYNFGTNDARNAARSRPDSISRTGHRQHRNSTKGGHRLAPQAEQETEEESEPILTH
jgi:methyl-accepting chemotaxis protein